ncbi:MAG: hypothetical protein K6357_00855 [Elusimicrobiota bacterium]
MQEQPEGKKIINNIKKHNFSTFTKILIFLFIFFLISFFSIKLLSNKIKNQISLRTKNFFENKLERKITYDKLHISTDFIELKNLLILEKKSEKEFASIKEIKVIFDIFPLLKKSDIIFDRIFFEKSRINFYKNFNWNFKDIIDLIGESHKPFYQRMIFREIKTKELDILIKTLKNELFFKNSNIDISHSINSTDFDIKAVSEIFAILNSKNTLTAKAQINSKIKIIDEIEMLDILNLSFENFEYENLKFSYGEIRGKYIKDKSLNLNIDIKDLSGYKMTKIYNLINSSYKKIYSKDIDISSQIDIQMNVEIEKNNRFNFEIISDEFTLNSKINYIENKSMWNFKTKNYYFKFESYSGKQKITSNFSETLNKFITEFIIKAETEFKKTSEVL